MRNEAAEEATKPAAAAASKGELSSYRNILKNTSLFGGVQVITIIISVIRSKFVALLLGPEGIGISGLYASSMAMIKSGTAMGLETSAIKNVAEAHGTGDRERVGHVTSVVRKLVWVTGLLGVAVAVAMSPLLSKWSFGDYSYTLPFVVVSAFLLLEQLKSGNMVLLQGTRQLRSLAKANVYGAALGTVTALPLYYFLGTAGIVPAMLVASATVLLLSRHFARKVDAPRERVGLRAALGEGRGMMSMGVTMSLTSLLGLVVAYAVRAYIRSLGGLDDVGFYNAGYTIQGTYVGLIFTAMATDFYPRLAAVNRDNKMCALLANRQADVAVTIMTPLLCFFLVYMPYVVILLYSKDFAPTNDFLVYSIPGMLFKALSFSISYIFVAKADIKQFAFNEIAIKCINTPLYIVAYRLGGLPWLGAAFSANYFLYALLVYAAARRRYGFRLEGTLLRAVAPQAACLAACLAAVLLLAGDTWAQLGAGTGVAAISTALALARLKKTFLVKR